MAQFARNKTQEEIREACREAGFPLDTSGYDRGSDYVKITFSHDGKTFDVLYSSFNGRFIGSSPGSDAVFSESNTELDPVPWYQALLNFLYVPECEAASRDRRRKGVRLRCPHNPTAA